MWGKLERRWSINFSASLDGFSQASEEMLMLDVCITIVTKDSIHAKFSVLFIKCYEQVETLLLSFLLHHFCGAQAPLHQKSQIKTSRRMARLVVPVAYALDPK
jgi:hypothetical protein